MSKRTTLRNKQKPDSVRRKAWEYVWAAGRPVTAAEVVAGLPGYNKNTIGPALSEFSDRGAMTRIKGPPDHYQVTAEQAKYMLANTVPSAPDILALLEEPKVVAPQPDPEPPTCAEINLAIREVLLVTRVPLDAEDLAEKTGIPLKYVRSELSHMATKEPHSAPHRSKLKGAGRSKVTYHYMKSQKAWDGWCSSL